MSLTPAPSLVYHLGLCVHLCVHAFVRVCARVCLGVCVYHLHPHNATAGPGAMHVCERQSRPAASGSHHLALLLHCAGANCPVSHDLQSYSEERLSVQGCWVSSEGQLSVQGCSMPSTPEILTGMQMNTKIVMLMTSSHIAYGECNYSRIHNYNQMTI